MHVVEYPEKLLRGISNRDFIDANGRPTVGLFQFDSVIREDGFVELSINWYDDEGAVYCIMNQVKENDGSKQFKKGAAILLHTKIKELFNAAKIMVGTEDFCSYERSPIAQNKYHGNILLKSNVDKTFKNFIINGLALTVVDFIDRELYESEKSIDKKITRV